MSISTIVGLIIAFGAVILSFIMEGGHIGALLAPTAALIVIGGTIGAIVISTPVKDLKRVGKIVGVAFKKRDTNLNELIEYFKNLAIFSRKEGLLSLEKEIQNAASIDPFIAKNLALVIDGIEPSKLREIMENQIYLSSERHKSGIAIFEAAGGFAPTMGIIGTVTGLVHVLGNLTDPDSLGPKIAVAFLATLYGIGTANLLWLPIANKLKALNKQENLEKEMMLQAIVSLQEGESPYVLEEKLKGFLVSGPNEEITIHNKNER